METHLIRSPQRKVGEFFEESEMEHDQRDFYVMVVILLVVGIVLFTIPAKSQEVHPASGVFCDTAEEMENFATLAGNGTPVQEAIEAINAAAQKPNACAGGNLLVAGISEVKALTVGEHDLIIVKLFVVAIVTMQGQVPVAPMEQYFLVNRSALHPARLAI